MPLGLWVLLESLADEQVRPPSDRAATCPLLLSNCLADGVRRRVDDIGLQVNSCARTGVVLIDTLPLGAMIACCSWSWWLVMCKGVVAQDYEVLAGSLRYPIGV